MAKALKTAGMVIAGAALIATGIGAAAGAGLLGAAAAASVSAAGVTIFGVSVSTLSGIGAGLTAAGTLLTKRPGVSTGGSPVQQAYDPSSGLPYPFGRTAVAGRIVYGTVTGPLKEGNKYRLFYSVISGVRIGGFESFSTNDETVSFTSDGGEGASGTYKNRMWQVRRTGAPDSRGYLRFTATGSKDTPADHGGNPPEWTAQHTFGEMAVTLTACEYDQKVYASDVKPLYVVNGALVYDPRLDDTYPGGAGPCRAYDESTYVQSKNPWLHCLTFAMGRYQNGVLVLGIGAALPFLPVGQFVEGANIAEANGWEIGGTAWSTDDKWAVLRSMAQAGGGDCFPLGGKIGCMVNAPRVSLATVDAEDIVGPCSASGTRGRRGRINGAIARYRSEAHGWEIVAADPIIVAAHVVEDRDQQRTREIDYPYVQNLAQAGQLARYDIENSRELGPISLRLGPKWMGFVPGDALTLNVPDLGLNGQLAVITKRAFDPATFTVTLELRSETTAKHAFALGQTATAPPIPTLTGNDVLLPGAPPAEDVTIEGGVVAGPGGSLPVIVYKVVLANQHASHVIVDYRQVTPAVGEWRSREWPVSSLAVDGDDNSLVTLTLDGLAAGAAYQSLIRFRSVRGVEDPSTATPLPDATTGGVDAGTLQGKSPGQIVADAEAALDPALDALAARATAVELDVAEAQAALFTPGAGVVSRVDVLEQETDDLFAGLSQEEATRIAADLAAAGRISATEARLRSLPNLIQNGDGSASTASEPRKGWSASNATINAYYDNAIGSFWAIAANPGPSHVYMFSDVYGIAALQQISVGFSGDMGTNVGATRPYAYLDWFYNGAQAGLALGGTGYLDSANLDWFDKRASFTATVPAAGVNGYRLVLAIPPGFSGGTISRVMVNFGPVAVPFRDDLTERNTRARVTTTELAQATTDSALANLTSRVSTSMQQGASLVANAPFGGYDALTGLPDGWLDWSWGTTAVRVAGQGANYSPRFTVAANTDVGVYQVIYLTPGRYVMNVQARVTAGDWKGAGAMIARSDNAGIVLGTLNCALDPDDGGSAGVGGVGVRRFTKVVEVTYAGNVNLYAMAGWGTFGPVTAKTVNFLTVDIYPVDAAVRASDAKAETALTSVSDLAGSYSSLKSETEANFTSPTGAVQVAKSQAIAESLADTNQAISAYDASTTASFGGLRAATGILQSAMTTVQGKVLAFLKLTASSGGDEAKVEVVADDGATLVRMVAKTISLASVVGGVVLDVLKIVAGEVFFGVPISIDVGGKRLTLGPGFGSSADLIMWFGPSAISVATMTKINGHWAMATDGKVYYGNAELGTGGTAVDGVVSKSASAANLAPNTGTHTQVATLDFSGVAAADLIEASIGFAQESGGTMSSAGTWAGGWEIVEQTTAGGSVTVVLSGVLSIDNTGGGAWDISSFTSTGSDAEWNTLRNRALTGAVRYGLRIWRDSGPTITGNGLRASMRIRRNP